jgi:hypothetical protein
VEHQGYDPEPADEPGWCTWKRWCSVCGKWFTHVYPASCTGVECDCGAFIDVPKLKVIRGGKR